MFFVEKYLSHIYTYMDHYIKQAMLLKKIASKSNANITPNNPVAASRQTPAPTSTNTPLTFGNNNDTDYYTQSKNLLMNFVQDPDKLNEIVDSLNEANSKYLSELTLNWPTYEETLKSLKGSVVSVGRVVDVLKDKLNVSLSRKQVSNPRISVKTKGSNITPFFFDLNRQTMHDFDEPKSVLKRILTNIIGISNTSNDKTILQEMDNTVFDQNPDAIRELTSYANVLALDKNKEIATMMTTLEDNFNKLIPADIFNDLISESNASCPPVFRENITPVKEPIPVPKIEKILRESNAYFVQRFNNLVDSFDKKNETKLATKIHLDNRNVRLDVRDRQQKDEKALNNKYNLELDKNKYYIPVEQMVQMLKASFRQKYKHYFKKTELLKKFKLITDEEKDFLLTPNPGRVKSMIDQKKSIFENGFKKIDQFIDHTGGMNMIEYIIEHPANDTGTKTILALIKDLATDEDYDKILTSVNVIKNDYDPTIIDSLPGANMEQLFFAHSKDNPNIVKNYSKKFNERLNPFPSNSDTAIYSTSDPNKGTATASAVSGEGLKSNEKIVNKKYYVNDKLLKDHGILEIRYVKNRHLAHVKPPMLSEKCKDCVIHMIDGRKINADNFVSLNQFEKNLLRKIDKLFESNQNLNDDDEENFSKNFELLKGSYLAGNDSHMVKQQLREYIHHAFDIGKINRYQRDRMLFDLKLV